MEDNKIQIEDDLSCDRSPASSDSANGSFMRFWDMQNGGFSSFASLESGTDLEGLIDDKDVAAKAVAFVVNTSRKGVVPLCAHIAKILRAKKRLETTVEEQKQELIKLRGPCGPPSGSGYSGRTSRSTSPTPPSLQSYDDSPHNRRRFKGLEHKLSRCSQCSSLSSSSPQDSQSLDQPATLYTITSAHTPTDHTPQPDPSVDHTRRRHDRVSNQLVIRAEVHSLPVEDRRLSNPVEPSVESSDRLHPPVETVSKEVQCSTLIEQSEELQRKYQQVAQAKTQLELDLRKAKAEIERLKVQLKAADELKEERQRVCEMSIVNETPSRKTSDEMSPRTNKSPSSSPVTLPQLNSGGKSPRNRSNSNSSNSKPGSPRSAIVILPGCKCTRCTEHQHSKSGHGRGHHTVPTTPGGAGYTTGTSHNRLTIHLDDHVSVRGDRTGYVRYIGHIDNATNPQAIYVGVQLDLPVGRNDGMIHGKRYFFCHRNHGVFLPIQDVTAIISRKPSKRPKTVEIIRKHSSDSDSSSSCTKHKQNGYPMKRNKAGQHKRLLSADSHNLISTSEIQPQPPVST